MRLENIELRSLAKIFFPPRTGHPPPFAITSPDVDEYPLQPSKLSHTLLNPSNYLPTLISIFSCLTHGVKPACHRILRTLTPRVALTQTKLLIRLNPQSVHIPSMVLVTQPRVEVQRTVGYPLEILRAAGAEDLTVLLRDAAVRADGVSAASRL
jgi:hypothetical protein